MSQRGEAVPNEGPDEIMIFFKAKFSVDYDYA